MVHGLSVTEMSRDLRAESGIEIASMQLTHRHSRTLRVRFCGTECMWGLAAALHNLRC